GGLAGQDQIGEDLSRLDDSVVVAAQVFAVALYHAVLVPVDFGVRAADVAGVAVFGYQLEGDFLAAAAYPDRWVGLLHALRLVDGPAHLVILALEGGIRLGPHGADDLE